MGNTPTRIIVAVCTHERNEPLRRLLESVERNSRQLGKRAAVGVVVVDDNVDHRAAATCDLFADTFSLGLHYVTSGEGNIAIARNKALDTAIPLSDWIAMTDDDCVPVDNWLSSFLDMHDRTGASAITGPCVLRASGTAPRWLVDEPFFEDGQFRFADGETLHVAATNNSFIDARFLRDHPWLRFEPALGVSGGEDMVFFRTAARAGLTIRFAAASIVHEDQPAHRETLRHQVRSRFWLGNTEYVTNAFLRDAPRLRWFARGVKLLVLALVRPIGRIARRQSPQWRYSLAGVARACGVLTGTFGLRARHH